LAQELKGVALISLLATSQQDEQGNGSS